MSSHFNFNHIFDSNTVRGRANVSEDIPRYIVHIYIYSSALITFPISFCFSVGYQGHLGIGGPHLCAGEDASSQRQAPRGHEVL